VVSALGVEGPVGREVVRALRTRCAETPLVVEDGRGADAEVRELLAGCVVVSAPLSEHEVVAAVDRALARRPEGA
jgi:hypothetical protein